MSAAGNRKVLFIASQPYFQWRGSPIRVGFNVRALAENGCSVDLLVLPFGEDRKTEGVNVVRAVNLFGFKDVSIGPSFAKACFDVVLLFKAWSLYRKNRYDVVHCVEDAGFIGVFLSVLYGVKFVFEKHSDPSSYKKGLIKNLIMSAYSSVERSFIRNADAVICTGPGLAEQAGSCSRGGAVHCICDIPSSLSEPDQEKTLAVRGGRGLNAGDVVAAYVGSFAVYQGVDLMFESFAIAAGKNSNLKLLVVGGSESEIEDRKSRLQGRGCIDSVIFAGKIPPDELPTTLAACDILISPRISGVNTPLKLLDYLKAGRAILAADTEANRIILDDEIAAFAAPDAKEFSKKLCELSDDAELRERLAANGRRLVDEKYNYRVFREKLKETYNGLGLE